MRRPDDLNLIVGNCCNERSRQQQDTRSRSGGIGVGINGGNGRGGGGPSFGIGEVGGRPLDGMVQIANPVGESNGAGWFFPRWYWPKDAALSIDSNPLQLNIGAWIIGGHLEVDR